MWYVVVGVSAVDSCDSEALESKREDCWRAGFLLAAAVIEVEDDQVVRSRRWCSTRGDDFNGTVLEKVSVPEMEALSTEGAGVWIKGPR